MIQARAALALMLCAVLVGCGGPRAPEGLEGVRLCGARSILGEPAEPIASRVRGCGLQDGVRVFSVSGVKLSTPATLSCDTARALDGWVSDAVIPAFQRRGGGVEELWVMASYVCRPRNGIPGNRISEHGRGRAIDIGGFTLANGETITVLRGWRSSTNGPVLQSLHSAACGPFGTVLGPRSDPFHQTHFHMDTATYRSGPYCR